MTTTAAQSPVRQPSLWACCSAFAQAPVGLFRPRRADRNFLQQLSDVGAPPATQTVRVRALRQMPKWVPTAGTVEGTRSPRRIPIALTAFVIEHPRARFVVDPGMCADVGTRVLSQLPAVLRPAVGPPAEAITTAAALAEELDENHVDFALPTHLHWDHICGLLDLPAMPVHIHQPELDWATSGPVAPAGGVRDSLQHRTITTFALDGPPILTFERSHDLFGDGAVQLVDLPGHTPGSIGLLLNTAGGWVLLAGDAAWHSLGVEHIRQKPSYPGVFADEDREASFRTLHRLHAVRDQVRIVPTHDHTASTSLPQS
ncbi:MBL fold metallo-hydrolase [Mycolicibacterium peregrinum]|uniref:MBL fold metallo-hydrolase n=1 Tax=Mycolicibacterium peregrinum TaxID=43304 RepID=UPI0007E9EFCA|nr:MBL fold metallo-hydrolase [Mycolicibacterium peregrinum]OBF33424.1 MBL fold metallo-hydrolase [Mycolicibacterium peregrinum]